MGNFIKSIGKVKNNKENMLFSDFASERRKRAEILFDILTIKLNGGNGKIDGKHEN